MEELNYIVAGAGSAGCVLAARIFEDPANKVLQIQAGGEGNGFLVNMPAGSCRLPPFMRWLMQSHRQHSSGPMSP
jgi:choline dehydrogenase